MKLMAIPTLLLLLSLAIPLKALEIREGVLPNKRLFAVRFPDNTSFYARHDRINSASMQRYQSGPYLVSEVVIDISGSDVLFRIYYTELIGTDTVISRSPDEPKTVVQPNVPDAVQKMIDRGREGLDEGRSGSLVVKDYPTSTHAKTAEYRVEFLGELDRFYTRFINILVGRNSPADENDTQATRIDMAGTVFIFEGVE